MKVMVIVKATTNSEAGVMPSMELLTAMGAYNEQLVKAGILLAGDGLQPSVKGKRIHFAGSTRTVVDGPFAETKELIAGYWIWQVRSMEEAWSGRVAARNPCPAKRAPWKSARSLRPRTSASSTRRNSRRVMPSSGTRSLDSRNNPRLANRRPPLRTAAGRWPGSCLQ